MSPRPRAPPSRCRGARSHCRSTCSHGAPRGGARHRHWTQLRRRSSARARCSPPDERVDAHRKKQDDSKESEVPVGVPVGKDDADLRKPDDEGANRSPDRGSIAAGQEAAYIAVPMKRMTLVRATGTPTLRAALESPPTA